MALMPYCDEELNFFKLSSIVLNEFPKALRQTFKKMWDNNFGHRPGFQLWDDSTAVRNLFVSTEGGATKVPTHQSYNEWDCTALFQATIYARSFALHRKTLSDLYVKPRRVPHGSFHASVLSPSGNNAETFALAIDQLQLLRNSLCHSTSSEIDKTMFDQCVQYAKDAFQALGASTALIDAVERLTESDFPTNEVRRLEKRTREETRAYIKFLEGVNSDIVELRSLSAAIKQKMESETANKEDVALLERKIDDLKIAQDERDDKETKTYTKILEGVSSDIDEIKQKVQCDPANKAEYIAVLEQKNSELKIVKDERDALLKNSGNNLPLIGKS